MLRKCWESVQTRSSLGEQLEKLQSTDTRLNDYRMFKTKDIEQLISKMHVPVLTKRRKAK